MRVGVAFPHTIGTDPDEVAAFARTLEDLGCSHLWVYDHVVGAVRSHRDPPLTGPYDETSPFHEVFVLCGYLAAMTTTIELVAAVLILPQRQTALVAKQAAEVQLLSRGRLRLGVGTGWNYVAYNALGTSFADRGRRQVEQIEVLRALWARRVVEYRGEWHDIDRAGILPLPPRPIPIWFGGSARAAGRRAAQLGDGFMFGGRLADAATGVAALRAHLEAAERDVDSFGFDVQIHATGGLDRFRADFERCVDFGATHVTISQHGLSFDSVAQRCDALAKLLEAVHPAGSDATPVGGGA